MALLLESFKRSGNAKVWPGARKELPARKKQYRASF
jgi:hypothetical protein